MTCFPKTRSFGIGFFHAGLRKLDEESFMTAAAMLEDVKASLKRVITGLFFDKAVLWDVALKNIDWLTERTCCNGDT